MFLQRSNDPSPIWVWPSTNSPTLVELVPRGLFGKKNIHDTYVSQTFIKSKVTAEILI